MITISYTDSETGDEVSVTLPSQKRVCPTCNGEGHLLTPEMRGHAYTQEEFDQAFSDEEAEEYFKRGGRYDVQCEECHGQNVVDVVATTSLTVDQRKHYKAWRDSQRQDAEYEAMCRAERLSGA